MLTATAVQPKTGVFMTAGWYHLAMLNFPIAAHVLEPYIPAGVELDGWRGQAYVSVVGFQFSDAKIFGVSIPFHRRFEEVNLRFYVRRATAEGWRRGVVFIREIAPRALVSVVARWFFNENYVTMPMRQRVAPPRPGVLGLVRYEWSHAGAWNDVTVGIEGNPQLPADGSFEEFITEHYWAYTRQPDGATVEYEVEHPPWRIWPASSAHYDCDVAAIYGPEFVPYLHDPTSAFVADGSPVVVRRGRRLPA